jgi:nucleoside-diphosphate-sugar epimerase
MKKQVILTGATGFVGHHVVPLLLQAGCAVTVLGRNEKQAQAFAWYDQVAFVVCDYHRERPEIALTKNATLIHLAWQGLPHYKKTFHFEENLPKNYDFIKHLVEAGVSKVLVAGTCLEYGLQNGPLVAEAETRPTVAYAFAKDSLRKQLTHLQNDRPFKLQWARLFYLYGRGQNPNSLLAQCDVAIAKGEPSFNMSFGEQLRDYLPIEVAAQQLVDIFSRDESGTFNVCSGEPISVRRLVENRIAQKKSNMNLNLGYYPYNDYEPMAFWGVK